MCHDCYLEIFIGRDRIHRDTEKYLQFKEYLLEHSIGMFNRPEGFVCDKCNYHSMLGYDIEEEVLVLFGMT